MHKAALWLLRAPLSPLFESVCVCVCMSVCAEREPPVSWSDSLPDWTANDSRSSSLLSLFIDTRSSWHTHVGNKLGKELSMTPLAPLWSSDYLIAGKNMSSWMKDCCEKLRETGHSAREALPSSRAVSTNRRRIHISAKRHESDHAAVPFQQFFRRSSRVRAIEKKRERRKQRGKTFLILSQD